MAKKKELVRNQEQFLVRLPQGMRERIKAKADRAGMSMNEAIVWCLDQYFPEPATLEGKIEHMATLAALLKKSNEFEKDVDVIIDELDTTLRKVAYGELSADKSFRASVSKQIEEWEADAAEDATNPFDDRNWTSNYWEPSEDDASLKDDPFADVPPKK